MNLIDRAKNIVLTPKSEWQVIAPESTSVGELYRSYIIPLALIGPIATFIGSALVGTSMPFMGTVRIPIGWALATAVLSYAVGLLSVYIIGLIINGFAPSFGGEKSPTQALKVAAYAFTPAWLAGVLHILPWLGILAILAALYGLYVLYLGLPVLMKAPQDKAVGYTAVVVVCSIVIMIVLGTIVGLVGTLGMGTSNLAQGLGSYGTATRAPSAADQMSAQIQAAAQQMQAAQKSGDTQAQVAAATNVIAAAAGGGTEITPVDQNVLKAMLPEAIGPLGRTSFEATKGGMGALQISKAEAHYGNDQGASIDLSIVDMAGTKMLGAFAAMASVESNKESDSGYETMSKIDGRPVHQRFEKNGPQSEYETLVAGRFMVQASGSKVDMDTVKGAVTALDLAKLEALKDEGVKKAN